MGRVGVYRFGINNVFNRQMSGVSSARIPTLYIVHAILTALGTRLVP